MSLINMETPVFQKLTAIVRGSGSLRPLGILAWTAAAGVAHALGGTSFEPGAVYTTTNDPRANMVAVFERGPDGAVTFDELVPTGGRGTGQGLGNQGAVILTQDERHLIAVNAGSDELSVFRVVENDLVLMSISSAFGDQPVSVAQHDDLIYVVNAGSDTIAGFRMQEDDTLAPIPGSVQLLSGPRVEPAQIGFHPDGRFLYVTEKATNLISVFALDANGAPEDHATQDSLGMTPFGFAFGKRGQLFVSEAQMEGELAGSVSSYVAGSRGALRPVSGAVPAQGTATCWLAATPEGRRAFVSNTGSNTLSSFVVGFEGNLDLHDPAAANTDNEPHDLALTPDGRFLYVLNGGGTIGDYAVEDDTSLTALPGSAGGLPPFASGLAVR
jgi:6-phosphogluconolactonase (cycloisomerase 2 family)